MKNCYLFLFVTLSFTTINAQYNWQTLTNAPGSYRFDDIYFLNPDKGWAIHPYYGDFWYYNFSPIQYAQVFSTDDGGQSWNMLFDSSMTYIRCVGFADSLNGWFGNLVDTSILADTNFLYHTVDGGHTWAPVLNVTGPKPKGICGISVINDSVIYAYGRYTGPAAFMKTTDRGQTWQSQDMSAYAFGLIDGWFFNADTGFLSGSIGADHNAVILSTFDGGNSWQIRHQTSRMQEHGWKFSFPSRNIGYASIEYLGGAADTTHFLKTTDGGITWQDEIFHTGGFYDEEGIGFINDSVGWIGGDCCISKTYKTNNGGDSWFVDSTFGSLVQPYNNGLAGYFINRFRRFSDTLMYASGNTIYKLEAPSVTSIATAVTVIGSVQVSPNPYKGYFDLTFKADNLEGTGKLEIYDITGRSLMSGISLQQGANRIETPTLKDGVYLYEIKSKNGRIAIGKIVAQ